MANPDLPQDILLEIFSRFPAKSVGKCRTLSKFWNTHLLTKTFINKHLITRQQNIQQQNLALTSKRRRLCIITSPTTNDEVIENHRHFISNTKRFDVIGSCNGLILLHGLMYGDENLLLMNPITLKEVHIQTHLLETEHRIELHGIMYGFGYDSCADDYKVVQITTFLSKYTTVVDVYSVKTHVWKRIDGCYPYGGLIPSRYAAEGAAFINGAVHWLICGRDGGFRSCIAAFDLANEVFHEIDLPYGFVRQTGNEVLHVNLLMGHNIPRTHGVSVVGGCLVIVDNLGNGDTDIWIMKEYGVAESWARFSIVAEYDDWLTINVTLCYIEGGELIFVTSRKYLLACDLERGTVRKVLLPGRNGWFANGMAFVDTLVSPEGSL